MQNRPGDQKNWSLISRVMTSFGPIVPIFIFVQILPNIPFEREFKEQQKRYGDYSKKINILEVIRQQSCQNVCNNINDESAIAVGASFLHV